MGQFHSNAFPGEDAQYRQSRDALLQAEMDLRRQVEEVARLRRGLPPGGTVKEDYLFEEMDGDRVRHTRLSELFALGRDSLIVYSFMYAPDAEAACPMCTAMLDSLDGSAPHVEARVNLAVVVKAPCPAEQLAQSGDIGRHPGIAMGGELFTFE